MARVGRLVRLVTVAVAGWIGLSPDLETPDRPVRRRAPSAKILAAPTAPAPLDLSGEPEPVPDPEVVPPPPERKPVVASIAPRPPLPPPKPASLSIPRGTMPFRADHLLEKEEAQRRVDKLLGYWAQKYGVRYMWNGDTAEISSKTFGLQVNARVLVTEADIQAWASDPGFLFRDKARDYLRWKLARYLDPSKTLEQVN